MAIIPGSTCVIKTNIKDIDITLIESAIFSFSVSVDEKPIVQKKYLTKGTSNVKYIDGNFIVPLTQQDTLLFDGNKNILYETQINFEDKSVSKTIYTKIQIRKTVATELIDGNAPNIKQDENYYEVKVDTVLYLNVSTEQIEDYVSQANTFAENAKTSMKNAKNSEDVTKNYCENASQYAQTSVEAANAAIAAQTSVENKISVANTLQNKAIEAATTAQQAKDTVLNIEEQVSADKIIVEDAKGEVISAKNETLLAKNEAVAAKEYVDTAKNEAVEASNDAISAATTSTQMATQAEQAKETVVGSIDNANTLLNNALDAADVIARQKTEIDQIAEQITADKANIEQSVTTVSTAKQDTITAKNEALTAKNDAVIAKDTAVEQANSASLNKDKTDTNVTTTKQLAEQVGEDKTEVSEMVTESRALLEEQRKLIGLMPTIYITQTIDEMRAIANPKEKDICFVLGNVQSAYMYYTTAIDGTALSNPTWVWLTDIQLVAPSKDYLLNILQLATVATTGSYTDLINKPNRYESFATVDDGVWDYSVADKIKLTADLVSISNVYNGAVGLIQTDLDITLPENSKKAYDYDYMDLPTGGMYQYTFLYDGSYYNWSRVVIA
nr:MAG TPA: hypothetical protein [Caudoviricetes sp.]